MKIIITFVRMVSVEVCVPWNRDPWTTIRSQDFHSKRHFFSREEQAPINHHLQKHHKIQDNNDAVKAIDFPTMNPPNIPYLVFGRLFEFIVELISHISKEQ